MRSRRKPVKPGDPGQLSQIHITKRGCKSSRGGVSAVSRENKPKSDYTRTSAWNTRRPRLRNNNKQQGQNLHSSFKGRHCISYMEVHDFSILALLLILLKDPNNFVKQR